MGTDQEEPQTDPGPGLSPRLFFALWPDPDLRGELAVFQRGLRQATGKGRWLPPQRLHLTLYYLGRLPLPVAKAVRSAARDIQAPEFSLQLDRLGCFERARVLWLGPSQVPQPLTELHQALRALPEACSHESQPSRFRPHVTLARKLRNLPELPEAAARLLPLPWQARDFALIESVDTPDGVEYRVVERYPLEPAGDSGSGPGLT